MTERIRFTVTAKDIRLGSRGKGTRCPVARALRQATDLRWFVDQEVAYVDTDEASMAVESIFVYKPSRRTAQFIDAFDNREPVEPFTGEVYR